MVAVTSGTKGRGALILVHMQLRSCSVHVRLLDVWDAFGFTQHVKRSDSQNCGVIDAQSGEVLVAA